MPTLHTFYLPKQNWHAPFLLEDQEAHHAIKVLRLKVNNIIRLIDGEGTEGTFKITKVTRQNLELELLEEQYKEEPKLKCTVAAGFSKAIRRSWFLEKSVELGASSIWLWQGDHSQAVLPTSSKKVWESSFIAGAKQCGTSRIPEIRLFPKGVLELIDSFNTFDKVYMLYEGDTGNLLLKQQDLMYTNILFVIGPEGGFSKKEVDLLINANALPISLGNQILRWETAAILALGLSWWSRQ